jgi:hypothetical protein
MSLPPSPPPADPGGSHDPEETRGLQAVADRASRRARIYRNWALLVLLVPTIASAITCAVAFQPGAGPAARNAFAFVIVFQLVVVPVAALLLFIFAAEQRAIARRNRPTARPASRQGPNLDVEAERLRRSAATYRRWLPAARALTFVLGAAGLLLGLACLAALVIGAARGAVNWVDLFGRPELLKLIANVVGLAVFIIGFPAWWLQKRHKARQRQAAMAETCADLGLRYVSRPVEGQLEPFAPLPLFRHGQRHRGEAIHLMAGEMAGWPVQVLVYGYDGSMEGSADARIRQTVLVTRLETPLPDFRIWPGMVQQSALAYLHLTATPARAGMDGDVIELPLGQLGPDVPWSQRYRAFARADERERLGPVLSERLTAFLQDHPGLVVDSASGWLAVYRRGEVWETDEYPECVAEALAVCAALRAGPQAEAPPAVS